MLSYVIVNDEDAAVSQSLHNPDVLADHPLSYQLSPEFRRGIYPLGW